MEPKRGGEAENPATWDDVERDIKQDAVNERVPEFFVAQKWEELYEMIGRVEEIPRDEGGKAYTLERILSRINTVRNFFDDEVGKGGDPKDLLAKYAYTLKNIPKYNRLRDSVLNLLKKQYKIKDELVDIELAPEDMRSKPEDLVDKIKDLEVPIIPLKELSGVAVPEDIILEENIDADAIERSGDWELQKGKNGAEDVFVFKTWDQQFKEIVNRNPRIEGGFNPKDLKKVLLRSKNEPEIENYKLAIEDREQRKLALEAYQEKLDRQNQAFL